MISQNRLARSRVGEGLPSSSQPDYCTILIREMEGLDYMVPESFRFLS